MGHVAIFTSRKGVNVADWGCFIYLFYLESWFLNTHHHTTLCESDGYLFLRQDLEMGVCELVTVSRSSV